MQLRRESDQPWLLANSLYENMADAMVRCLGMMRSFRPSVFAGDVLFFQESDNQHKSDNRAWAPFTLGKVVVHSIDCPHARMTDGQHLPEIARIIAAAMSDTAPFETSSASEFTGT